MSQGSPTSVSSDLHTKMANTDLLCVGFGVKDEVSYTCLGYINSAGMAVFSVGFTQLCLVFKRGTNDPCRMDHN